MAEPISDEVLAGIDETAPFCRYGCEASLHARAMTGEIRSLRAELAKYVGWEPTVREEYEHACAIAERAEEVVRKFVAAPMLAVNQFVADLKNALEM
jgi:hypothetical protein